jgi:hypothetical protein
MLLSTTANQASGSQPALTRAARTTRMRKRKKRRSPALLPSKIAL